MYRTKKTVSLLLTLVILALSVCAFAVPAFAEYDGLYRGSEFTDDAALAKKLDDIFYGRAQIFKKVVGADGKTIQNAQTKYAVGESYNPKLKYYWTDYNWGGSCLAYAQACYNYLFGESTVNPAAFTFKKDKKGVVRSSKSFVALEKKDFLTYNDLKKAKVGLGAYVRTTGNEDYSFNSVNGHSFLILSYDKEYLTFLEGNADYRGLIAIQHMTWETFNQRRMTNQGRRLCFVIQPNVTAGKIKEVAERTQAPQTTVPPAKETPVAGDYNGNGHVDAEDARMALRVAVDLEPDIRSGSEAYDILNVNGDKIVNSEDARILLRRAVGLPD